MYPSPFSGHRLVFSVSLCITSLGIGYILDRPSLVRQCVAYTHHTAAGSADAPRGAGAARAAENAIDRYFMSASQTVSFKRGVCWSVAYVLLYSIYPDHHDGPCTHAGHSAQAGHLEDKCIPGL